MEADLRRGLLQNNDNVIAFISSPITLLFLGLTILSLSWPLIANALASRRSAVYGPE